MKKSIKKLSESETKFLTALIQDGSKSDTEIAKEIGVSKATAGRIRKSLQSGGIVQDYIPIVDLKQFDVDMFVVIMFRWNASDNKQLTQKLNKDLDQDPHVIFLANGHGSNGLTTVLFLGFKDVEEYNSYFDRLNLKYGNNMGNIITLISSTKGIVKQDYLPLVLKRLKGTKAKNGKD